MHVYAHITIRIFPYKQKYKICINKYTAKLNLELEAEQVMFREKIQKQRETLEAAMNAQVSIQIRFHRITDKLNQK
jgi:hypothetical protein